MLSTFLAGIAVGSMLYVGLLRRLRNETLLLAVLQVLVGVGFAVSGMLFANLQALSIALRGSEHVASFSQSVRMMFLNSALILFVPTLFLGATFPLATALCARGLRELGHAIGRAYAVNTLGAILGSVGCGFVMIPLLGMQGTLTALILVNGASAIALALADGRSMTSRLVTSGVFAVAVVAAVVAIPPDIFRRTFVFGAEKLAFYAEGATDTVGVVDVYDQRFIRYEDMRGTAGTLSFRYNYYFGHFPMLLHPGTPRRVLHICFGVGNSLSAVIRHDELERVDNVELSPHVVEAAPYFWTNSDVIESPKVRTIIDDGRNYIMATKETYDVIAMEPPETFTAGVINLYTREFYQDALARLAPDGIMMQWIPTGEAPLDDERTLFRAFSDVFPHVTVWKQINSGCMLLIGTKQPLTIDYQRLIARMHAPAIARDLELVGIQDADHLLSFLIFDEPGVAEFVRGVEPVTDDRTVLDFTIPRGLGSGFGLGTFNTKATVDGRNPWSEAFERERWYLDHRRSAVPLLRNLGAETPEAIQARIEERTQIKLPHGGVPHAQWQR
jgi:spermidine synthase